MTPIIALEEARKIEIISLMDNAVDYISTSSHEQVRSLWYWSGKKGEMPIGEHGFSMLVRVFNGEDSCSVLFDAGISPNGVVENAARMGIDLREVSFVVLSHGHYDHFGGLTSVIKAIKKQDLPIIAHENMVKRRGHSTLNGEIRESHPFPKTEELYPAKIVYTKKPTLIANDLVCVTGEIPRTVEFETGLIQNRIFSDGAWRPDPLILDERALVINVKNKGLVVISGCAHAGIINTIRYAQQITGIEKIYGVLGGFHLAGREFEKRIAPTVETLKEISPTLIGASHCTGWRAIKAIANALPDAFVFSGVGTQYKL
jgi:7,8-dihydropterin-6-yl-methyl-4-(beta-D-ribofuranosyl)aminobenzene 5'-phosphate synthase